MSRKKILVTEDEAIVAMDIKQRLEAQGFRVTATVATGADAIRSIEDNRPDLVLMDIQIRGNIDGIETAAMVHERFQVPVIFLTANSDTSTIDRAKTVGPTAYLLKPFDDRELKASIDIALYRHELECALRNQKEWWYTALNSIGDAVVTVDTQSKVTFLNPAAEKLTQINLSEATGSPLDDVFVLVNEETGEPIKTPVQTSLEAGATVLLSNHSALIRPDESLLPIEHTAAPIFSQEREIIGAILVFHDATQSRERETRARAHQVELKRQVDARTAELLEANEQLRQEIKERERMEAERVRLQNQLKKAEKMESLGMLAGGVAHDLNNILSPILGYPGLIMAGLPQNSPFIKDLKTIEKSAQTAADVIQDLLTLARRRRYEMEATDINEVINGFAESATFTELAASKPGIDVVFELEDGIEPVSGSDTHLTKVLMNLVTNAFDAMAKEGTLTICSEQRHLDRLLSGYDDIVPGDYVVLRVKDTGIGIEPADREKIFEPYYSRKALGRSSGSGLGLSIVFGVVKDHNGYWDLTSEVGKGTEFITYFPTSSVPPKEKPVVVEEKGGQETLLIVDDVPELRDLSSKYLSSLGYQVSSVTCGREAVEYLEEAEADLVLLDMIMEPDFDGLDTFREILKEHPNQKVLILSGYSENERVQKAMQLGAQGFVGKPFSLQDLAQSVRQGLH